MQSEQVMKSSIILNFRCCSFQRDDEESDPNNREQPEPVPGVGGMVAVLARMKRKDTPPPPYEDPPSYDVAIQIKE